MKTLFISDLHLSPDQPELIRLATDFVAQQVNVDAFYIVGDIFNTWLGDDLVPTEFDPFIQALQNLQQQGSKIYLMVGNRDFMLGKDFARRVGGTLLDDPVMIDVYGHKILLMHGDSLCTDDVSYQRYRKVVRNRWLQKLFLAMPLTVRQGISDKIKAKSKQQKQYKQAQIMDVNPASVRQVMQQYNATLLLHGHTHRPAIHTLQSSQNNSNYRIVLGDWQPDASYIEITPEKIRLVDKRLSEGQSILSLN
ncbi:MULTISPECIES: UDP-2,3-diacylglucosamine diphosphatase [unclassified Methylophaga]|jgi:UDP-2,3-diacylglucosamine hydrolase|uniref:UDP-2,3-diacylglucosamine diphosphatase n=1 Tax=unclassified Methylophaga TaxID=2629249 RepID=UPI000C93D85C|nr:MULTISPECIES: UDP-2,3-diacylglucosamine diphosphatase [unclassified Methylophaga]MAP28204.1 UDP-2,3-diacylglucosamine diphosphatase [Methylophaga sp.]HBX59704.1 UDP-2,3-diacylglucosamine diphosphatase [Methylophaga sp.]HCO00893.1 UDP-2,3-diacylglucosamine diphosphatase [Methylophaga sp.]|tara:strand:- start:1599 stop:2351 length:753 start_codon:yes stop_codon:yes gene_type:complete